MHKRQDIFLARVFYADSPESKTRPCIILSNDAYNRTGYVMISPLTTANDEYCLRIGWEDCNCELDKDSGARIDTIFRINIKHLIKFLGRTNPEFHRKLIDKIVGQIRQ
jgi:mRNA-degrading endonuclease toxin of MazEF toxin-antitoxin module